MKRLCFKRQLRYFLNLTLIKLFGTRLKKWRSLLCGCVFGMSHQCLLTFVHRIPLPLLLWSIKTINHLAVTRGWIDFSWKDHSVRFQAAACNCGLKADKKSSRQCLKVFLVLLIRSKWEMNRMTITVWCVASHRENSGCEEDCKW